MYTTGSSSSTAAISRPFASCGVAGMITLSPAMCAKILWWLCVCCGPLPQPRPTIARMTMGTGCTPPNIDRHFAAWFTS